MAAGSREAVLAQVGRRKGWASGHGVAGRGRRSPAAIAPPTVPHAPHAPWFVDVAINSTAHAGIIVDGVHVADEMVALALRARPVADRTFRVSGAMPAIGGPERFSLYGAEIRVQEGQLVNLEGSLAGAHVTIAESLARLIGVIGLAPEAALRMAVTIPAELIGQPALARPEGRPADEALVLGDGWHATGHLGEIAADTAPSAAGR